MRHRLSLQVQAVKQAREPASFLSAVQHCSLSSLGSIELELRLDAVRFKWPLQKLARDGLVNIASQVRLFRAFLEFYVFLSKVPC